MFEQLLTIGRNTFVESIRQPVFLAVVVVGMIAMVLNPSLAAYTFLDDNKLLIDLGMSTLLLTGLWLAALTATSVISNEIENRTVLTTISKPVARPVFVVGKFAGVAGAMALAFWVLTIIFLMTVRHRVMTTASDHFDGPVLTFSIVAGLAALALATVMNYFYRWVFISTLVLWLAALQTLAWIMVLLIDKDWRFQAITAEFTAPDSVLIQLHLALLLLFEVLVIITAVAVAASTRLGQVMTLVICMAVFVLGLIGSALTHGSAAHLPVIEWLGRLTPNLQYLWHADALTQGHDIPIKHVALVSAYAWLFVLAILSLAVALFQTREVG